MESINVKGTKISLNNIEWELLFTVGVIDDIQVHFDIHINSIADVLNPEKREFYDNIAFIIMTLVNERIEIKNETSQETQKLFELKEIKRMITSKNVYTYSKAILEAFFSSFMKSDKNPNAVSGMTAI